MQSRRNAGQTGAKKPYIPRLMPIGAALILVMILIPLIRGERRGQVARKNVEAPIAMQIYSTGYERLDSLMNEGVRRFGRKDYETAARYFAEAYFYWNVLIREKREVRYPEDLRFLYALSQFYRGRPELAIPLLEEEKRDAPLSSKYPWYLAHAYLAMERFAEARTEFEKVVELGGEFEKEARKKLSSLEASESKPR